MGLAMGARSGTSHSRLPGDGSGLRAAHHEAGMEHQVSGLGHCDGKGTREADLGRGVGTVQLRARRAARAGAAASLRVRVAPLL